MTTDTVAEQLETARTWLAAADRVLITAGAGLSAAAGYDYTDQRRFAELFPVLHSMGLRARYEMIGRRLPAPLLWGFWSVHVDDVRFGSMPSPLYQQLRTLVGNRDSFVMTSNVDQLFARNGFSSAQLYSPQGDYGLYQCLTPCSREVWDSAPLVQRALEHFDAETGQVAPDGIPSCPRCGGEVFLNVYAGSWYINDHFQAGRTRLESWLKDAHSSGESVAIVEIGAGFNTPGVIRLPGEHIATQLPGSKFIRINPDFPEVPEHLGDRAIGVGVGADIAIDAFGTTAA